MTNEEATRVDSLSRGATTSSADRGTSTAVSDVPPTPGPWFYAHRECADGFWRTQVFDLGGDAIATFDWYPFEKGDGVIATSRDANARLCAAAPDLLAALRESERWVAKLAADAPEGMVGRANVLSRVLVQIAAAIAKAEGR